MPEGDTIFRAAQTLHRVFAGRVVTGFSSVLPYLNRVVEDHPLAGRTIESVVARGKHLLIAFSGNLILHTHMRSKVFVPGPKVPVCWLGATVPQEMHHREIPKALMNSDEHLMWRVYHVLCYHSCVASPNIFVHNGSLNFPSALTSGRQSAIVKQPWNDWWKLSPRVKRSASIFRIGACSCCVL